MFGQNQVGWFKAIPKARLVSPFFIIDIRIWAIPPLTLVRIDSINIPS